MDKLPASIHHPGAFRASPPANCDGIFDWEFLLPAFAGTKIQPTDLDAVIERFRRVLILETKQPGKVVPQGQRILLEALVRIGGGSICAMVVYGKNEPSIIGIDEWHWHHREQRIIKFRAGCDAKSLLGRVSVWFQWADGRIRTEEWERRWQELWRIDQQK